MKMDFEIPSIPDTHFEPKINYKALEEMAKSRDEYLTTLRNAILSIDKQQQVSLLVPYHLCCDIIDKCIAPVLIGVKPATIIDALPV